MLSFYSARVRLPSRCAARLSSRVYSTGVPAASNRLFYRSAAAVALGIGAGTALWPREDQTPHLEATITEPVVSEEVLSKEAVTNLISKQAYSVLTSKIPGLVKYDGTQVASNAPCEDGFFHGRFPAPWQHGKQWMAWAVLDGHAGWQTAKLLEVKLLPYVRQSLAKMQEPSGNEPIPAHLVQNAITQGFVNLDESIMKTAEAASLSDEPLQVKAGKMAPAFAGSCALLSLYDPDTSTLHVACTGDSRAVLGQRRPDGTWEAIPLSVDQTGSNTEEIARLQKEHPGESNIVKGGRVLGIMVSRAFGDSRWKWPLDFQQDMHRRYYGPAPLTPKYDVRTPPYLTAEPVVTSTRIDLTRPTFLIMATDGLWDNLDNQQAVDLTGRWLEWNHGKSEKASTPRSVSQDSKFDFGDFGTKLEERFVAERETYEDGNSAVHLVRNALGGAHHELLAGRLAFTPPFSRSVRDDVTVQVVIFQDHVAS